MNKVCKDCKIEKPISDFYKDGNYHRSNCKKCHNKKLWENRKDNPKYKNYMNEYSKAYFKKKKDGKYRVYILPMCDYYVGYTGNEYERMMHHRKQKHDTSDYWILHECDTEIEAKEYEKIYHDIGFPNKNKDIKKTLPK